MMDFDKIAEKIRESFLSDLNKLGLEDIFKVPLEYLIGKERFFGDFYVIYLSEIFGIKNEETIIKLGNAFLFGRAFVIAQDQILDNPNNLNVNYVLFLPVLYQEFVKKMIKLVNKTDFEEEMYQILKESREANIKEQQKHKGEVLTYNQKDLDNLGKKTGIVKIPAKAVCYLKEIRNKKEIISSIMDKILIVIQICDDLSDVEEDFKAGNYTLPVTQGILLSPNQTKSEKSIYQGLFFSGLFECLLSCNINLLKQANEDIGIITQKEIEIKKYLSSLKNYLVNILEKFRITKRSFNLESIEENNFTKLKQTKYKGEFDMLIQYLEKLEPSNIAPKKIE